MDLEGGSTAEFPCLEYKCGSDDPEVFESLGEQSDGLWGAPWVEPCVGPGCVCEGGDEVSRPGAFPEKFAVWAVGEAGSEGSAEIR